jgi:hypothetical protein
LWFFSDAKGGESSIIIMYHLELTPESYEDLFLLFLQSPLVRPSISGLKGDKGDPGSQPLGGGLDEIPVIDGQEGVNHK